MGKPIVYGPRYSVYTRAAIMALMEKRVEHEVVHIDMDAKEHKAPPHLARHPFGMLPAFEHNGFKIYETGAILHYIDDAFPGTRLTPNDIHRRTRAEQIISVINAYGYRPIVWGIFVPRTFTEPGKPVDEAAIAAAVPAAEQSLKAIEDLMTNPDPFLVGRQISLADLLLEPIIHYFAGTSEGKRILPLYPKLTAWHHALQSCPSVAQTVPVL
ncbi:MAG TPA: glutathione S-transferase family protein [Dongiaceae bacterium]|jgi:glutathione S-transferase